jgi:hypothetical protein
MPHTNTEEGVLKKEESTTGDVEDTPIVKDFKKFVHDRTGLPIETMHTIYYQAGDFGVRIDGAGDISSLKTDFFLIK